MSRITSYLLLCLALLTTACHKDDPEPEPTLEGTWQLQNLQMSGTIIGGRTLYTNTPLPLPATPEELVLTNSTLTVQTTYFGVGVIPTIDSTVPFTLPYTRQGAILQFSTFGSLTIAKLTEHTLELQKIDTLKNSDGNIRLVRNGSYTR